MAGRPNHSTTLGAVSVAGRVALRTVVTDTTTLVGRYFSGIRRIFIAQSPSVARSSGGAFYVLAFAFEPAGVT